MITTKDFLKKFSIYAVGNIASKMIIFLLYPVLTFFLAPEELGIFDIALSLTLWVGTATMLNMRDGMFRFVMSGDAETFNAVIKIFLKVFLINVAIVALGVLIYLILGIDLNINIYYLAIFFLAMNFMDVYRQIIRGKGETKIFVLGNILSALFIAIITILLLKTTSLKNESLLIAYSLSKFLTFLITEKLTPTLFKKSYYTSVDLAKSKEINTKMVSYSLFLLPANLAILGVENWGRIFLVTYVDEYVLGLYAIAVKFGSIFFVLTTIYQQTWQECAIRDYNNVNRNQYFSKYYNNYLLFLSVVSVAITIFIHIFCEYLISPMYYDSIKYISLQLLSVMFFALGAFLNLVYECSFTVKRSMYSAVLATIMSFALNALLIPYWGLMGSIISNVIAGMSMFVFRLIDIRKFVVIKLSKIGVYAILLIIINILCCIYIDFLI